MVYLFGVVTFVGLAAAPIAAPAASTSATLDFAREGRTAKGPHVGRDHHPFATTMFLAGGGLKPDFTWGATDELGFNIVENPVHVHDVQATLLHLLGIDHTRLTYRFQGRDFRLTDVHGRVVHEILA